MVRANWAGDRDCGLTFDGMRHVVIDNHQRSLGGQARSRDKQTVCKNWHSKTIGYGII